MRKNILLVLCFLILAAASLSSLDFWQYPEMADKHALFAGIFGVSLSAQHENYFNVDDPELHLDYLLALGFPLSIGLSVRPFSGEFFAIGIRPGYHINLGGDNTDLYLLYTTDLVLEGEYTYLELGGRIGIRRLFGRYVCLHIETGHNFKSVNFGVSIKIN